MSKRDKLRQKLRNNPKGVKFTEVEMLLQRFDFTLVRVSGSHHVFRFDAAQSAINVVVHVHGNTVKAPYVREVIEILDEFFPEVPSDEEEDDE